MSPDGEKIGRIVSVVYDVLELAEIDPQTQIEIMFACMDCIMTDYTRDADGRFTLGLLGFVEQRVNSFLVTLHEEIAEVRRERQS